MMRLEFQNKDLMMVDDRYAICHCISVDCAMGKGVVVPIIKKYAGIKKACLDFVKSKRDNDTIGCAFRYSCKMGVVYNLFSKQIVRHKAGRGVTVEQYHRNLRSCLEDMKNQMLTNDETFLAMPKIACGLDGCNWEDVEQIIRNVFEGTDMEILVCVI